MIKLQRQRTPAAVPGGLRGSYRRRKYRQLLLDHLRGTALDNSYWTSSSWAPAKKQLRRETGGKCAYCESPADAVAHCDVEHFRPKDKYWWLVYCYDNYLFACQICNEVYKVNHFPVHGPQLPAPKVVAPLTDADLDAFLTAHLPDPLQESPAFHLACAGELPGLVDPYAVDPEPLFRWRADGALKEVELLPRDNTARSQQIFQAVQDHYGINREQLRRWRWTLAYKHLKRYKKILDDAGSRRRTTACREALEGILDMMNPGEPYAGMVRYFACDAWDLFRRTATGFQPVQNPGAPSRRR
jgi:uncharacterized protein (TIGR02646 family)